MVHRITVNHSKKLKIFQWSISFRLKTFMRYNIGQLICDPLYFLRIILLRRYCIQKKQITIRLLVVSEKVFGLVWVVIKHRRATLDGNGKMTSPSCSHDGDWINLIWEMWTWNRRNHAFTLIKVTKPYWAKVKVQTTESRRSANVNGSKS